MFCEETFNDLQESYEHMNKIHGFFFREANSLVDKKGLIELLRMMIEKNFYCLSCASIFSSADAAK